MTPDPAGPSRRILLVTSGFPAEGREPFIGPEVDALLDQGHDLLLVPLRVWAPSMRRPRDGHETHAIEPLLSLPILGSALAAVGRHPLRAAKALGMVLTARPRLLAKNLAAFPKAMWLARLARKWRADHIHAHWVSTTSSMAMAASAYTRIPWSFTAHRWDILEANLIRRKVASAAVARFISERGRDHAVEHSGAERGRTTVIHMGIRLPGTPPVRRREDRVTLVCTAAFIPRKGHDVLVRALAQLRDLPWRMVMSRDGPSRAPTEAMARQLGLADRITFAGELDHDQVLALLADPATTAMVLASSEADASMAEGIPVSLMEAMAVGLPVVATDSGGTAELLGGGAGVLVPPGDADALAKALRGLLMDPSARRRLSLAGRARVEGEFWAQQTASQLTAALDANHGWMTS